MRQSLRSISMVCTVLLLSSTSVLLAQDDEDELPLLAEMEIPSVKDILLGEPRDWVVLKERSEGNEVIVSEPVFPRPNTLEKIEELISQKFEDRPSDPAKLPKYREELEALNYLNLTLPEEKENPEFKLHKKFVEKIIYHEDLVLMRIDKLMEEGNLRTSYEMLYKLERQVPDWEGILDRKNTMLFRQAELELEKNSPYEALVYLEQLAAKEPNYKGLSKRAGEAAGVLIKGAMDEENHRKARHYLYRLRKIDVKNEVAVQWTDKFESRAKVFLDQSRELSEAGKHDEALVAAIEGAKIWPQTRGLQSRYNQATRRFQSVRVATQYLPRQTGSYFLPTPADFRERRLTTARFFRVKSFDTHPHYHSNYLERWDPADLGKRTSFVLRQELPLWDPRPPLTAVPIVNDLLARIDPENERYDERIASLIDGLSVESPYQFTVNFSRAPLRIEALLNHPIRPVGVSEDESEDNAVAGPLLSPRFVLHDKGPGRNVYRRSTPQPDNRSEYKLAEIVEYKFPNTDVAIQSLLRNNVQMLLDLEPWRVDIFKNAKTYAVVKLALPVTHVLQINPRSEKLKSIEFRRALGYSINREKYLRELMLRSDKLDHGRLVTGPFPRLSYANNPRVPLPEYDPSLAFALTFAAKSALKVKELPTLKMICPPDRAARSAAERMVSTWKKLGVTVELLPDDAETPDDWDIIYRLEQMTEPITQLWPFLTLTETARMSDLEYLPDWLRKEVVALDDAANQNEATERLWNLHEFLVSRAEIIPLWEIDQHLVYRTRSLSRHRETDFQGNPQRPIEIYQSAERWNVEPVYESR